MKIEKFELLSALAIVKPGLANQDIMEQTTSFAFMDGRVVTYNDELSISHPINVDITGAVDANEIYGLLQKLTAKEIDITITTDEIKIKSGKVRAGIKLAEEIVLPIKEEIGDLTDEDWISIPDTKEFCNHISLAMKTCGSDMTKYKLTCVYIRKNGFIQGSDGFRLIQCKGKEFGVDDFLLPATVAPEVVKLEPTEICIQGSWAHFRNDQDTIISTRISDEEYVEQEKIDSILHCKSETTLTFPKDILKIIDKLRVFAKRDFVHDEQILIDIVNGKITLRAKSEKGSWVKERTSIECDKEISITITPSLFQDILNETRTCKIAEDTQKLKFISKKNNWEYAVFLRG